MFRKLSCHFSFIFEYKVLIIFIYLFICTPLFHGAVLLTSTLPKHIQAVLYIYDKCIVTKLCLFKLFNKVSMQAHAASYICSIFIFFISLPHCISPIPSLFFILYLSHLSSPPPFIPLSHYLYHFLSHSLSSLCIMLFFIPFSFLLSLFLSFRLSLSTSLTYSNFHTRYFYIY